MERIESLVDVTRLVLLVSHAQQLNAMIHAMQAPIATT
jgi:hypothetical protein